MNGILAALMPQQRAPGHGQAAAGAPAPQAESPGAGKGFSGAVERAAAETGAQRERMSERSAGQAEASGPTGRPLTPDVQIDGTLTGGGLPGGPATGINWAAGRDGTPLGGSLTDTPDVNKAALPVADTGASATATPGATSEPRQVSAAKTAVAAQGLAIDAEAGAPRQIRIPASLASTPAGASSLAHRAATADGATTDAASAHAQKLPASGSQADARGAETGAVRTQDAPGTERPPIAPATAVDRPPTHTAPRMAAVPPPQAGPDAKPQQASPGPDAHDAVTPAPPPGARPDGNPSPGSPASRSAPVAQRDTPTSAPQAQPHPGVSSAAGDGPAPDVPERGGTAVGAQARIVPAPSALVAGGTAPSGEAPAESLAPSRAGSTGDAAPDMTRHGALASAAPGAASGPSREASAALADQVLAASGDPQPGRTSDPLQTVRQAAAQPSAAPPSPAALVSAALAVAPSSGRIELHLEPAELGKIEISFDFGPDAVRAVLTSERAATSDLLRRHAEQFLAQLREAGFENAELSFEERNAGQEHGRDDPRLHIAGAPIGTQESGAGDADDLSRQPPPRLADAGTLDIRL